jgi:hypothetical protein
MKISLANKFVSAKKKKSPGIGPQPSKFEASSLTHGHLLRGDQAPICTQHGKPELYILGDDSLNASDVLTSLGGRGVSKSVLLNVVYKSPCGLIIGFVLFLYS